MLTLRELRKERNLTLKQVSEATGIHVINLCQHEKGLHCPTKKTREKLEKFYGTKFNFLAMKTMTIDPDEDQDPIACEKIFRKLLCQISSLPPDIQKAYSQTIIQILNQLNSN